MNYNPNQPRDGNGRWTKTGAANFINDYGDEVAIGLAVAGAAALTYGAVVAVGATPGVAAVIESGGPQLARTLTARRVGPIATGKVASLFKDSAFKKAIPKSFEAWQYHKGAFSILPDDTIVPVGRLFRDLKVGAQINTGGGAKVFGAPKPFGYENMTFQSSNKLKAFGKGLGVTAGAVGATTNLVQRKNK